MPLSRVTPRQVHLLRRALEGAGEREALDILEGLEGDVYHGYGARAYAQRLLLLYLEPQGVADEALEPLALLATAEENVPWRQETLRRLRRLSPAFSFVEVAAPAANVYGHLGAGPQAFVFSLDLSQEAEAPAPQEACALMEEAWRRLSPAPSLGVHRLRLGTPKGYLYGEVLVEGQEACFHPRASALPPSPAEATSPAPWVRGSLEEVLEVLFQEEAGVAPRSRPVFLVAPWRQGSFEEALPQARPPTPPATP